jgi:hypothetical protein
MADDELEAIKEDIEKDVTQVDSIDEQQVKDELHAMGFLWHTVNEKLKKDGICFECKKEINIGGDALHVVFVNNGVEKGACAFVGICDKCKEKVEGESNE